MDIQGNPRYRSHGIQDRKTEGQIRDEVAVHYIEVKQVGVIVQQQDVIFQMEEVRSEY